LIGLFLLKNLFLIIRVHIGKLALFSPNKQLNCKKVTYYSYFGSISRKLVWRWHRTNTYKQRNSKIRENTEQLHYGIFS